MQTEFLLHLTRKICSADSAEDGELEEEEEEGGMKGAWAVGGDDLYLGGCKSDGAKISLLSPGERVQLRMGGEMI